MALLKNFQPAVFKNITVMRYLKKELKGVNLSLSLTCCRAPAVAQASPGESKWPSCAACEPKSHLGKPNPRGKHWPVAGHEDAGGWPFAHPQGAAGLACAALQLPKSSQFPWTPGTCSQGSKTQFCLKYWEALNCLWHPRWGNAGMRRRGNQGLLYRGNKKHALRVPGFSYYRLQTRLGFLFCF